MRLMKFGLIAYGLTAVFLFGVTIFIQSGYDCNNYTKYHYDDQTQMFNNKKSCDSFVSWMIIIPIVAVSVMFAIGIPRLIHWSRLEDARRSDS